MKINTIVSLETPTNIKPMHYYGGIFIIFSILWSWKVDNIIADKFDLIGGAIALIEAAIIMYDPRG